MHTNFEADAPERGTTKRKLHFSSSDALAVFAAVCLFGPLSYALIDVYEAVLYQILSGFLVPFVLLVLFAFFRYPGWLRI